MSGHLSCGRTDAAYELLTPNISVIWNPGNLYIAINHYGRATYDNQIDYTRNHGVITPNIKDIVNNSDTYVGMIIDDGLGQEIWNNIRNFIGEILQHKSIKEQLREHLEYSH